MKSTPRIIAKIDLEAVVDNADTIMRIFGSTNEFAQKFSELQETIRMHYDVKDFLRLGPADQLNEAVSKAYHAFVDYQRQQKWSDER